jgi:hypothetical protein
LATLPLRKTIIKWWLYRRLEVRRRRLSLKLVTAALFVLVLVATGRGAKDYRDDALKVTPEVEAFMAEHDITGADLEKVYKIIEVAHDKFLFPRVERGRMEKWLVNPKEEADYRAFLQEKKISLKRLYDKRSSSLLTAEEDKQRQEWQREVFMGDHDLKVFDEVIRKKDILPQDIPFAVSGAEAVVYGISDGCTTAAKTFIVLALAAGLKETRYVTTGNVPDYNLACPAKGKSRKPDITINGHFFAMVKVDGRWALVNCTYFDPYSEDEKTRYEIFFSLDGQDVDPEMLRSRILRVPSFQQEAAKGAPNSPPTRLYVIGVGRDRRDDMDIENYDALMNLSVSGDRNSPICRYDRF